MFKNFLTVAWRRMTRQKTYTLINVLGLAIGMAGAMFILFWVRDERSYDQFHENADRIYRVNQAFHYGDYHLEQTQTPAVLATRLRAECPDVELVTRVRGYREERLVQAGEKKFNERGVGIADESFFRVFSFPLIVGDPGSVLEEPSAVAISARSAKKYFGDSDPMGRALAISGQDYKVTGVFKDMPSQSHFHFDVLCSFASFEQYRQPSWGTNVFKTYVRLRSGARIDVLENQLADIVKSHMFRTPEDYAAVIARGDYTKFLLQPLTEIHLDSHLLWEFEANGNGTYVKFFTIIAVFVLVIAAINYINLSTARSAGRAREVGIRKTVGSMRSSLVRQFMMESILTSLLAFFLSLAFLHVFWRAYCNLVGKPWLLIPYRENLVWLIPLIILAGSIGAMAGIYPSLFLSSFKPISALKAKFSRGKKRFGLRNVLVVFQFCLSVLLLVSTLIVHQQMVYTQTRHLGYHREQVVVVQTYGELAQKQSVLKDALRIHPSIISVSASSSLPGTGFTNIGMGLEGTNSSQGTNMFIVDADFLDVMKIEMAEGRFFNREIPMDGQAVIINQSLARKLKADDLLGKRMRIWAGTTSGTQLFPIIGIVKDFHYESLHEPIKPLAMVMLNGTVPWSESYVSIRVRTEDMRETISEIRETWESVAPGTPFKFSFLDSIYDAQYQNEARTGRIFTIFTMLAVFVACIGLMGLSSYTAEQRTKEIAIRKVLGAPVRRLVLMLSAEFAGWVTGAILMAWPLAYYLMVLWLRGFAYRTEIRLHPFLLSAILMFAATGLTAGYHAVRSALAQPADSLRSE